MSSISDGAAGSRALLRDSLSDVVQGTQMLEILHSLRVLSLKNALNCIPQHNANMKDVSFKGAGKKAWCQYQTHCRDACVRML